MVELRLKKRVRRTVAGSVGSDVSNDAYRGDNFPRSTVEDNDDPVHFLKCDGRRMSCFACYTTCNGSGEKVHFEQKCKKTHPSRKKHYSYISHNHKYFFCPMEFPCSSQDWGLHVRRSH